ncbi:MAG: hypothetical protein JWR13_5987 [Mycobacterium sp.]|jgi:hypothetical protein|nr:hypothetical protein [Mycobacterium sp.]MCW2735171.1 hypothetical protein [Mycobacterium sp.]MDT5315413.1 hypothetical protein [Mycobacterium sp.]
MFEFADPDGNAWVVQQIKVRAGNPFCRTSRTSGA